MAELNSRFLLYEAQQAHFYGLSADLALASVTSTPATVLGLDHRIGFVRQGASVRKAEVVQIPYMMYTPNRV
jgi:hypothetical protein